MHTQWHLSGNPSRQFSCVAGQWKTENLKQQPVVMIARGLTGPDQACDPKPWNILNVNMLKLAPNLQKKSISHYSSCHPSVLTAGSLFLSSSLSSARSMLKPFSWAALYSGLNTSSSLRLTKHDVWYQRSIKPSWGFSGSTVFLDTRIWSWRRGQRMPHWIQ